NPTEYFSEITEAYYGRNDFFPFTRDDLKSYDQDGHALLEHLWNLSAEPQLFSLSLATGIVSAKQTSHIETDLATVPVVGGSLTASASPSQLLTFRLVLGGPRLNLK
ncbi:MAG: hypothetical protein ABI651_18710, partial [Verrucomicrobiota bacterium]